MAKDELLTRLFHEYAGSRPESLTMLPKSGSDRIYCRIKKGDISVLGVWNPSRKENDAFTYYSGHFRKNGLPVPEVLSYIPGEMVYLIEDLGELDLCMWVNDMGRNEAETGEIEEMYRKVLHELVRFQLDAGRTVDFNMAYPRQEFDRNSVMWDLNYFKYMFLKLSGTGFDEQLLEDDFGKLADLIGNVKTHGFLYRDFQSRNIMIKDGGPWFIDFQGGRKGAPHYDVASLLLDPYTELDKSLHDRLLEYYTSMLAGKVDCDRDTFLHQYPVFGIVRILQALGAYGFRGLYENKPNFAESIPPAVRQLDRVLKGNDLPGILPELGRISEALLEKWGKR